MHCTSSHTSLTALPPPLNYSSQHGNTSRDERGSEQLLLKTSGSRSDCRDNPRANKTDQMLVNHKSITSSLEHVTCCEFKCFIDVGYLQTVRGKPIISQASINLESKAAVLAETYRSIATLLRVNKWDQLNPTAARGRSAFLRGRIWGSAMLFSVVFVVTFPVAESKKTWHSLIL